MIEQHYQTLFEQLHHEAVVLTPTRRLARHCHKAYAKLQTKKTFITPQIYAFDDWLETLWLDNAHLVTPQYLSKKLLSDNQCLVIWQAIIEQAMVEQPLLAVKSTAKKAFDAYLMIHAWQLDLALFQQSQQIDVQAFCQWQQQFTAYCATEHSLVKSLLANHLLTLPELKHHPRQLIMTGFDELVPVQQQLFAYFVEQGIAVSTCDIQINAESVRVPIINQQQEWQAAARFAQAALADDNQQMIGIVIPELATEQEAVLTSICEVLYPMRPLAWQQEVNFPFTMSAGRALRDVPIVDAVMMICKLLTQAQSFEVISSLLRQPFFWSSAEHDQLLAIERYLSQGVHEAFTLEQLIEAMTNYLSLHTELEQFIPLSKLLQLQTFSQQQGHKSLHLSAWCQYFSRILVIIGWPGALPVSSLEFQAITRLHEIFDELCTLDTVLGQVPINTALRYLEQALSDRNFQVEADDRQIHILGMLEAGGLLYDKLWICNLYDENWPPLANPNPFIPLELQTKHGLPHANAERELVFSAKLIERFQHSSKQLVLSYPQFHEDKPLVMSPLLSDVPEHSLESLRQADLIDLYHYRNGALLHKYNDHQGPAVALNERSVGSHVLKSQSACAFQSFARYRLQLRRQEQPQTQLDAATSGVIIHDILQALWMRLKDSVALHQLSEHEQSDLIENLVQHALGLRANHLREQQLKLEQQRLQRLITNWLQYEKQRSPFVVLAIEKAVKLPLAGLELRLRIDRIDQIEQQQVIIDYKTGQTQLSYWFGPRPHEPQMLSYLTAQSQADALVYAQINRKEMRFKGYSDHDFLQDVTPVQKRAKQLQVDGWQDYRAQAQQTLSSLAQAYAQGEASLNPKLSSLTCQYCEMALLCRVQQSEGDFADVD